MTDVLKTLVQKKKPFSEGEEKEALYYCRYGEVFGGSASMSAVPKYLIVKIKEGNFTM